MDESFVARHLLRATGAHDKRFFSKRKDDPPTFFFVRLYIILLSQLPGAAAPLHSLFHPRRLHKGQGNFHFSNGFSIRRFFQPLVDTCGTRSSR
jgi:hypothetical protein